jgi:hypothetical protein
MEKIMSNFWPKGIEISDTQSPRQILEAARNDWDEHSNGNMTLILQESESDSGNDVIIVHAKHFSGNRTTTLFTVISRPNAPYPATIQPRKEFLPDALKRTYYKPGILEGVQTTVDFRSGKEIINDWVSDSPSEFRTNLEQVFNLSPVKSAILNLLSISGTKVVLNDDDLVEEYVEED